MPDLIIIDGGKGQLGAACEALSEMGIENDIIGLAKKQEEVFRPGNSLPILLPRRSEALFLLQRVRDEAHRFAITFHRKLRAKRSILSELDKLPGVGPARRKLLLDRFGTFANLKKATIEEIKAIPKIPASFAENVWKLLHAPEPQETMEEEALSNEESDAAVDLESTDETGDSEENESELELDDADVPQDESDT